MSHFTTIETQIKDIDALRAACAEMDLLLLENTEARGYGSNARHGDHVIRLKGPYDIAVNHDASGTCQLTTDWWDGHVEREVGPNFGRLLQLYAVHKASMEARRRGYRVQRENQTNGEIKLVLQGK